MFKIPGIVIGLTILIILGFVLAWRYPADTEREPAVSVVDVPSVPVGEPVSSAPVPILEGLEIPWSVTFLSEGVVLVTERTGLLRVFDVGGEELASRDLGMTARGGESGLHGVALHPDYEENGWLYLYTARPDPGGGLINSVERYRFNRAGGYELLERKVVVGDIPGAIYHDGGRIAFGPDGFLYITTGDARSPESAQDTGSLAGKILRVTDEGEPAPGNPFGNRVYSYGHRNPQGIVWDEAGNLWSTEHGRSGLRSGLDELNLIVKGGNYGWPDLQGDDVREGFVAPVLHSGSETWAPASAEYVNGSVVWGGLRGETLYQAVLGEGGTVSELRRHYTGVYGRLRDVVLTPDGRRLLFSTSNRDGRGDVRDGDDKVFSVSVDAVL